MNNGIGVCPYKLDKQIDCYGYSAKGAVICNFLIDNDRRRKECHRFDRVAELQKNTPTCCQELQIFHYRCAEEIGSLAGSFDIRKYPNDGKDVWRNYERVKFLFCPFCGKSQSDSDNCDS